MRAWWLFALSGLGLAASAACTGNDAPFRLAADSGSGAFAGDASLGGASGAGGAADAGAIPLGDMAAALAGAVCKNAQACFGPLVEQVTGGEDCVSYFTNKFTDGLGSLLEASVGAGALTYDPVKAAQCIAELDPANGCFNPRQPPDNCKIALGGLKSNGQPCKHLYECVQGSFCDTSGGCTTATCKPYGQVGTPCVDDRECASGLGCFIPPADGGLGTCQPDSKTGDGCDPQTKPECEPGSFCLAKVCVSLRNVFVGGLGAPCFANSLLCSEGNACEFSGLAFISPAQCVADAPHPNCGPALPDSCGSGAFCNPVLNNGTCVALPGPGVACASGVEQAAHITPSCAAGSTCIVGTCRQYAHLNQSCYADDQCWSGFCEGADPKAASASGACKPPACL